MRVQIFQSGGRAWRIWSTAFALLFVLVACGGGVDSGGTGGPVSTQSFSSGRISGFGSIVVNGVHFDESHADIVDDDGVTHPRSDLKLGMVVEVDAGPITLDPASSVPTAVATRVHFGPAIAGPVQAVDVAGSSVTVLGQTVKVDDGTVFEGSTTGLLGLRAGDVLQVHALLDTNSGIYTATRIERVGALGIYRLRGIVANLDTTAKTFFVGAAKISYAGVDAATVQALANGNFVKLTLRTAQQGGAWVLVSAAPSDTAIPEAAEADVEGIVGNFTGLSRFRVDGTLVDASGADVVFLNGTSAVIGNGVRVEVEGTVRNGVVVAKTVDIRAGNSVANKQVDLQGTIQSANAAQHTFVVRDTTVTYDTGTNFVRGTAADLAVGTQVDVKGELVNNGSQVHASKIKVGK